MRMNDVNLAYLFSRLDGIRIALEDITVLLQKIEHNQPNSEDHE